MRRPSHFVNFHDGPDDAEPPAKRRLLNLETTMPNKIDGNCIADLLAQQKAIMDNALEMANNVDFTSILEDAMRLGIDDSDRDDLAIDTTLSLHRDAVFDRHMSYMRSIMLDSLQTPELHYPLSQLNDMSKEQAFVIKMPKKENSQMFSAKTFQKGDILLFRPAEEQVTILNIIRRNNKTDYIVRRQDGNAQTVLAARLEPFAKTDDMDEDNSKVVSMPIHQPLTATEDTRGELGDICIQHSMLPLYSMEPLEYPENFVVNLVLRPPHCEGGGDCLPTARDVIRLAQASLYYKQPVIIAIATPGILCMFSLYRSFVKQLAEQRKPYQQKRIRVLAQNATVLKNRNVKDATHIEEIYRNLLTPSETGSQPVVWISVTSI